MKDGFIKVAAATPEVRVADCAYNAEKIIATMHEAHQMGAKICVLPELCVTGYTCQDLFLQHTLLRAAEQAISRIVAASSKQDMLTVIGAPLEHGGKLYNCAIVFKDGCILGIVPKTHLPNYNEFYEARHFAPAPTKLTNIRLAGQQIPFGSSLLFACNSLPELVFGVELCEDLWAPVPVSCALAAAGATVIGNPSASDEVIGKDSYRRSLVCGQSARLVCGYIYASAGEGESTQDLVFSGHNMIAENGGMLEESVLFCNRTILSELDLSKLCAERRRLNTYPAAQAEGFCTIPFDMQIENTHLSRPISKTPFIPQDIHERRQRCDMILRMQAQGLKKRLSHTQSQTVVIGVSGGLDSSLALLVCCQAMDMLGRPREDIQAVTMPCFGTTTRTRNNAQALCEYLGVSFRQVDISQAVRQHFADIGHAESEHTIVYENAQARERTQVLMDIANQKNGLVIGTGDLSELALGWATYNGDHMSMYGVNASIPKTLIRHMIEYYASNTHNASLQQVLNDILDTPVSPELLPTDDSKSLMIQKTEDLVGPYELHDFFLYYTIRFGYTPAKILRLATLAFADAYPPAIIKKWLQSFYRRFFAQQFKRSCLPDGPKVGSVTLSPRGDWRMPSDASAASWLTDLEKE